MYNTLNQLLHCGNLNPVCVMQRVYEHVWLACVMLRVSTGCLACG